MRWTRRILLALTATVLVSSVGLVAAPAGAAPSAPAAAASSDVAPGIRDSVVRLYQATFDRAPDQGGQDFWVDKYVRGMPLVNIAQHFMTSQEWQSRFGAVDDDRFIALLYDHVLDREPDGPGAAYWRDKLSQGHWRSTILINFSESDELISSTGTAAPVPPPPSPHPAVPANSGSGMRIVYGNSAHRIWMVDAYDLVVDSYLVSGRAGTPGPGTYSVYSKSERAWAGHDGITMRWMVRFAHGSRLAIGFHSIPRYADGRPLQSESQLGTYQSAGCIRQADHKAEALYRWAPIGTTVVVLR